MVSYNSYKKRAIVVALTALSFSVSAVFAGSMGSVCSAVNSTVPCETTGWGFGAKALYLQPSIGTRDINVTGTLLSVDGKTRYASLDPSYAWGFQVEGSYHFNTGNDVNLNWSRIEHSTTRHFGALDIGVPIAPVVTESKDTISPSWNAVNLEFGQRVDFGEMKTIRFYGGATYARIAADIDRNNSAIIFGALVTAHTVRESVYNGFGPRLGADMAYGWGNGLGIYANTATALLVGTQSFDDNVYRTSLPAVIARSASMTAVVPELEAKLGATYTYAIAQGDLILDAGWMWINYFDSNLYDKYRTGVLSSQGVETSNFALQGPYIGLKWTGNIA